MSKKPVLGTDPEFFIYEKEGKKYKLISADKLLPGKDNKKVYSVYGSIFFDGVQAEINPKQEVCREYLMRNTRSVIKSFVNENRDKELFIRPVASVKLDIEKDLKGCDAECFRFGCAPDYNIYTDEIIDYPDGGEFPHRFSGGHIHIGYDSSFTGINKEVLTKNKSIYNILKLLDSTLGVMSVALMPTEEEKFRRGYYGHAGSYRVQPHGLEYRTLSSFWLIAPEIMSLVFGIARDCYHLEQTKHADSVLSKIDIEEVVNIINNHQVSSAKKWYHEVIKPLYKPKGMKKYIGTASPLRNSKVIDVVDKFIDNGLNHYYNDYYAGRYWSIDGKRFLNEYKVQYGMYVFANYVNTGIIKLEDLYTIGEQ